MNKDKNLRDLIGRLGYIRTQRNLSAREVSLRMGYSESWYYRVESGEIDISISTLYALMELFEISPSELFYYDIAKYKEDEEILNLLKKMTKEDKLAVSHLLQNRK